MTTSKNQRLHSWVEAVADLCQPDRIHWCDGSQAEYDEMFRLHARERHRAPARPGEAAQQLTSSVRPGRRRARGGPHLHLLREAGSTRARPTTGATRPRCATTLARLFARLHARPHALRDPVQHGPARARRSRTSASQLTDSPYVVANMRIMTRMGQDGARRARATATSCRASTRSASRSRPASRTCRGRATPTNKYIVHFPETREIWSLRLGLRRQRAARQEVLRAAHRVGDGARRGLARRAHADPEAHLARRARRATSRPRSRARAARRTSRCSSPRMPGWKVETVGDDIAWMKFGERRPALRDQPRGGLLRRGAGHEHEVEPERACATLARERASSPTSRSRRTATSGGRT